MWYDHGIAGYGAIAVKKKMVSHTLDTLPPLTEAQRVNLAALAKRPDSEIDTSDIPEMTEEKWKNAVRRKLYKIRRDRRLRT